MLAVLEAILYPQYLGSLLFIIECNLYGCLSGQARPDQSVPLEHLLLASTLARRDRITEDKPTHQPDFTVAARSMAGLALLSRDKIV